MSLLRKCGKGQQTEPIWKKNQNISTILLNEDTYFFKIKYYPVIATIHRKSRLLTLCWLNRSPLFQVLKNVSDIICDRVAIGLQHTGQICFAHWNQFIEIVWEGLIVRTRYQATNTAHTIKCKAIVIIFANIDHYQEKRYVPNIKHSNQKCNRLCRL